MLLLQKSREYHLFQVSFAAARHPLRSVGSVLDAVVVLAQVSKAACGAVAINGVALAGRRMLYDCCLNGGHGDAVAMCHTRCFVGVFWRLLELPQTTGSMHFRFSPHISLRLYTQASHTHIIYITPAGSC